MPKSLFMLVAIAGAVAGVVSIPEAEARRHGHVVRVDGPNGSAVGRRHVWREGGDARIVRSGRTSDGRGYRSVRTVDREPGQSHATRSFKTRSGQGFDSERQRNWSDGAYSATASRTTADGRQTSRSVIAQNNGDGTATYSASRIRADGTTQTRSGTVPYRPR